MLKTLTGTHPAARAARFTAAILAIGSLAWPAAASQELLVTTAQEATLQDQVLNERSALVENGDLETGEAGGCSVLVDSNAVVELCGGTKVRFERNPEKGNRIVNVEAGEVRLVVEPRQAGERIEIHTPAAIATILGTVVYVSVDPVTGATTISSSQSNVNIRAKDELETDATMISANEQMTLVPGQAKGLKKLLTPEEVSELGGCMLDFHDIAVEVDRLPQQNRVATRVALVDTGVVDLPPVTTGGVDPVPPDTTDPVSGGTPFTPIVGLPTPTPTPTSMPPPMEVMPCTAGPLAGVHCGP